MAMTRSTIMERTCLSPLLRRMHQYPRRENRVQNCDKLGLAFDPETEPTCHFQRGGSRRRDHRCDAIFRKSWQEIAAWLTGASGLVTSFVIIDDVDLGISNLFPHRFVKTRGRTGFNPKALTDACRILTTPYPDQVAGIVDAFAPRNSHSG